MIHDKTIFIIYTGFILGLTELYIVSVWMLEAALFIMVIFLENKTHFILPVFHFPNYGT